MDLLGHHVLKICVELYRRGVNGLENFVVVESLLQNVMVVYWTVELEAVGCVVFVVYD